MKRIALLGLVAGSAALALSVQAKPLTYELPEDAVAYKPGPNLDAAQGNCGSCHSADYILTQPPQTAEKKKAFWEAEVTKMIKVYGAPINEADVPKIVEYLTATY